MDIQRLIEFKTIVECGSINKAAEKLYVSQSTLSRSVQRLEQEFDVQLLDRSKNQLSLTDIGERVLSQIDIILEDYNSLKNVSSLFQKRPENYITIAATSIAALRYFSAEFNKLNTDGYIAYGTSTTYENILNLIDDDEYDVFIHNKPIEEDGIVNYKWGAIRYYVNVSKQSPLYDHDSVNVLDLNGANVLCLKDKSLLLDLLRSLGLNINYIVESEYSIFHSLIQSNPDLLCLVSDLSTKDYLSFGRKNIPIEGSVFTTDVYVSFKEKNSPRLGPYITWLKNDSYKSSVSWNPSPDRSSEH